MTGKLMGDLLVRDGANPTVLPVGSLAPCGRASIRGAEGLDPRLSQSAKRLPDASRTETPPDQEGGCWGPIFVKCRNRRM